jgi:hypothetical protein
MVEIPTEKIYCHVCCNNTIKKYPALVCSLCKNNGEFDFYACEKLINKLNDLIKPPKKLKVNKK